MAEPAGAGWAAAGYGRGMRRIRALLVDIDGMLTVSWPPLPGAVATLARLRADRYPVALVTDTTSRSRASIARALATAGLAHRCSSRVRQTFGTPQADAARTHDQPGSECR